LGFICACLVIALVCVWSKSSTTEEANPDARVITLQDENQKLTAQNKDLENACNTVNEAYDKLKDENEVLKYLWSKKGVNIYWCPVLCWFVTMSNKSLLQAGVEIKSCIQTIILLPLNLFTDVIFVWLVNGFFIAFLCVVYEICITQTVTQTVMLNAMNNTLACMTYPWKIVINNMPSVYETCTNPAGWILPFNWNIW